MPKKKESDDLKDVVVNCGIVCTLKLSNIQKVTEFIGTLNGQIIFVKKSVDKLWIKEGEKNEN